jgi:hypothetical protein
MVSWLGLSACAEARGVRASDLPWSASPCPAWCRRCRAPDRGRDGTEVLVRALTFPGQGADRDAMRISALRAWPRDALKEHHHA